MEYLRNEEIINNNLIGQAISENLGYPYTDLSNFHPDEDLLSKIPSSVAHKHRVVLVKDDKEEVTVATDNPKASGLAQDLKLGKGKKIKITYAFTDDIDNALGYYKKPLDTRFKNILESEGRVAPEIIKEIVNDALEFKASDIHFEPQREEVVIRFRIDGVLREAGRFKKDNYENIINRLKVMAQLRTDEHYATQDGAIRFDLGETEVDMRLSIAPVLDGEKITIRLLAQYVKDLALSELGLCEKDQAVFERISKKPFGMILVTGPTGSGKTTTLYSLIKHINNPGLNITSIEDPVEYRIAGTNQIQVNPEKNITFAGGLKSILRQDPDVILVGEIRDHDTAEIAVNASLTGHLLFSTFHANDAATAIPRLLEMEVEPFLLASTIEVIVAQRLVRKICPSCRASQIIRANEIENNYLGLGKYFGKGPNTIYRGKGCSVCNNTGYIGRVAVFEYIEITREMQDLILADPSSKQIWDLAKKQGAHTLLEDGIDKVKNGVTTLEELVRVVAVE